MKKPFLILIDGPIGAGKSTVAKILHKKLARTALISLDRLKHLISDFRIDNPEDLQLAANIGAAMSKEYLKNGINIIVEKAFTDKKYVNSFLKSIGSKNARVFIYQIEAPLEVRKERVKKRPFPPEVKKKPSIIKMKRNTYHYEQLKYNRAIVFDSSKLSAKQIANKILRNIGGKK